MGPSSSSHVNLLLFIKSKSVDAYNSCRNVKEEEELEALLDVDALLAFEIRGLLLQRGESGSSVSCCSLNKAAAAERRFRPAEELDVSRPPWLLGEGTIIMIPPLSSSDDVVARL